MCFLMLIANRSKDWTDLSHAQDERKGSQRLENTQSTEQKKRQGETLWESQKERKKIEPGNRMSKKKKAVE